MTTINYSNGASIDSVIEILEDLHAERAGFFRAFWVSLADIAVHGTGQTGSPVIGYCSPGGSHRTIRATVAEVRKMGYTDPVFRNTRQIA